MTTIRILTETELRSCVPLDLDAVAVVEEAFLTLAEGRVTMPPILRLDVPEHNGEVDVKTAYVPGLDGFAIKISPGFFSNPQLGLPSVNGLMVVFSSQTGLAQALLLDNGYLTDVRTAAAGAVAAKYLAPQRVRVAGVIGAGVQARLQLQALTLVRPVEAVRVWARDPERAQVCAADLAAGLGLPARAMASAEELVRESDIVVTATAAHEPVLQAGWLHPGLHITAMGSDAEHKNELAPAVLMRADLYACDSRVQAARLGELHHAIAAGLIAADADIAELGAVAAGTRPGRQGEHQVTVCDLTGTGVQDTAIALHALRNASERGLGTTIET
ncbi:MAG: cyclodeaminase [Alphaproteobacteria bacterium]|jgi:ornithine cyclodeaminase|nr:cyclodeaminase [Alphaproteobacteria bacterium]